MSPLVMPLICISEKKSVQISNHYGPCHHRKHTSSFLIKSGPKSSSSSTTVRAIEPSAMLCAIFFVRFHLLQIYSAKIRKNGLLSRKKLKQNQIYCERDGIRLTLNLAQTNAVKIILNCLCNTDTVFMYEQDSCVK